MIIKFETAEEAERFHRIMNTPHSTNDGAYRLLEVAKISDTTQWEDSQIGKLLDDFEKKFKVILYFTVDDPESGYPSIKLACGTESPLIFYFLSEIDPIKIYRPKFTNESIFNDEFKKCAVDLLNQINYFSLYEILKRTRRITSYEDE